MKQFNMLGRHLIAKTFARSVAVNISSWHYGSKNCEILAQTKRPMGTGSTVEQKKDFFVRTAAAVVC